MTEIVEFIEARLAERAAEAPAIHALGCDAHSRCPDGCCTMGTCDCGEPEQILADIEAKRRLIDWVFINAHNIDGEWGCGCSAAEIRAGECDDHGQRATEMPLWLLASLFAGHPGFKPEWRIDG